MEKWAIFFIYPKILIHLSQSYCKYRKRIPLLISSFLNRFVRDLLPDLELGLLDHFEMLIALAFPCFLKVFFLLSWIDRKVLFLFFGFHLYCMYIQWNQFCMQSLKSLFLVSVFISSNLFLWFILCLIVSFQDLAFLYWSSCFGLLLLIYLFFLNVETDFHFSSWSCFKKCLI